MFDFDKIIERKSDKCRKWDHQFVCSRFGAVPQDFIPLWIADMDFTSPPTVIEGFQRIVEHGTFGYTYCFDEFYNTVIGFQRKRHHVDVERNWITLTYGTVSTLHYLVQTFCQPGDSVMMNTPVYDPFAMATQRQGVKVLANPLKIDNNRYQLDFTLVEAQLKSHKPKLWFFCSPHNPSGRIWTLDEIRQVSDLCQRYGVILVVDEVHAEHLLEGEFTSCLASEGAAQDNLILLTSPNKAFNLGGLKTSYSIIPDHGLRQRFRQQLEKNSITSPNIFGVWGMTLAYQQGLPWLDALNGYLRGNAQYLADALKVYFPEWKMMTPESSYLAWVDVSDSGRTATEVVNHFARNCGVIIEDGSHYVQDGERFIRINFGTQRYWLEQAIERMQKHY
ncbi:TPA: putative C-S lyase [Salmonella enterica subsp. indica]|uniref:cysteine-S-conjugate beta-lyase n=3 Tax=Salmonella enterica TaxID=28901 RepID=A0A702E314_SALER|nr:PatB family C-S lyase [Salmonella enterica]EEJ9031297.1 putative C-S lyase [Salmonella enterica subsp. enterica serovar Oslo]EEM2500543.1 putative C-S lyase [Salmonella enterica subsp. indica serovar 45:a:e,n,x]ESE86805.1 class I and II aminotransferase [Salmonella enterica subsp. indica serovar 6,14,25:z10:1,(2),7 str. 1121]HAC6564120.1 putative C-S lyase [Salmonella enterica subsp. indica]HCM1934221.1 PatB family C-S lyase [Salmonella enterica subsp. indica serovar 6,7:z41:1,7]